MSEGTGASQRLEHISDTARWVAVYRAWETERPDALFHDPFARRLAGERGEAIVRNLPQGKSMAWSMIVRTALIDDLLLRTLAHGKVTVVVNLAAGLDARPYRLPLAPDLQWVEVDLPAISEYKRQILAEDKPRCRLRSVVQDLSDGEGRRRLFDELSRQAGGGEVLVISEGLLAYLMPAQVEELARDLHAPPNFNWWILDYASPAVLRMMKRHYGKRLQAAQAPMHFAPENGTGYFHKLGWQTVEDRHYLDESERLQRTMPGFWMIRLHRRLMPRGFARRVKRWTSGVALFTRG